MENQNVDITKEPVVTAVEWFHGYGGNALGLGRAIPGLRPIAVCERDAFVVANMVAKMEAGLPDAVPVWTDCKDFPVEPFSGGRVGIFIASYPCQGFSHAGKRLGADDGRHLWPYCRRFIQGARPGLVFLENVEGHVSLGLSTVLADLEEDGYRAAWGIFSASEVGAPHQRKRVFILAYLVSKGPQGHAGDVDRSGDERAGAGGPVAEGGVPGGPGEGPVDDAAGLRSGESANGGSEPSGAYASGGERAVWPSRPGEQQHGWEPPRVVGNLEHAARGEDDQRGPGSVAEEARSRGGSEDAAGGAGGREVKPSLGGNADGPAPGLDFAGCTGLSDTELEEIYGWMVKGTNRTDELRLCGNGVVPQCAEKAFRTLYAELTEKQIGN